MKNRVYIASTDGLYIAGLYIAGSCGPFKFSAKVYGSPSKYGVDGGKVSKLSIHDEEGFRPIVHYDRGWDVKPQTQDQWDALRDILEALEDVQAIPMRRPVWRVG